MTPVPIGRLYCGTQTVTSVPSGAARPPIVKLPTKTWGGILLSIPGKITGTGVGAGSVAVGVKVGVGTGVFVGVGINVAVGTGVAVPSRSTSEAQADKINNNTEMTKKATASFSK